MVPLILAVIYFATAPTTLPGEDAGEFAYLALAGGIAHPPGYPLYTMILRIAGACLPKAHIVLGLSSLSILFAVAAAAVAFRVTADMLQNRGVAAASVLAVFLSVPVWRAATTIEPFALNFFLASLILYGSWQWLSNRSKPKILNFCFSSFLVGSALGLGVCHHHTLALMLPIPVFAAILGWRRGQIAYSHLLWSLIGFLTGLLPLIYFACADRSVPMSWGEWSDVRSNLAHHLLRKDYGGFSRLIEDTWQYSEGPRYFILQMPQMLSAFFVAAAAIGATATFKRIAKKNPIDTDVAAVGLCFLAFLCTGIFLLSLSKLHFDATVSIRQAINGQIVGRFFGLSYFCLIPVIGTGLIEVGRYIRNDFLKYTLFGGAIVLQGVSNLAAADRRADNFLDRHLRNTFEIIKADAPTSIPLVIVDSDAECFGLQFAQIAYESVPNIRVVCHGMWNMAWYRKKVVHAYAFAPKLADVPISELISNLQQDNDIYYAGPTNEDLKRNFVHSYPVGYFIKFVGATPSLPSLQAVYSLNRMLFTSRLLLPPEDKSQLDPSSLPILMKYANTWRTLAKAFEDQNSPALAESCRYIQSLLE